MPAHSHWHDCHDLPERPPRKVHAALHDRGVLPERYMPLAAVLAVAAVWVDYSVVAAAPYEAFWARPITRLVLALASALIGPANPRDPGPVSRN